MELKKENIKHASGNLSDVTAFGLDSSSASVIIGMLTRQYSDPEMAFIRETSSNAYDAHIAAGTQKKPFDIHIPTPFAPHIEIRDYGTGLSKEFMLNKYTQVGHSTKRKSNAQIGGFGIGRLSFLIVTEQAAITSYHDGMKYSYTVNYDSEGQLIISLTDERPSEEPSGLRLKFPVQTNRVEAFRQAAKKYFSRVSATLPNFVDSNLDIEPPTYSTKTKYWGLRTNGATNIIYAIMGNIAYPIRTDTLKYDNTFKSVHDLLDSGIDLFFDIGEVIPLPTRENLDMCEQTMNALRKRLELVKEELFKTLNDKIKKAPNRWVAYKHFAEIYTASSYNLKRVLNSLGYKYKGEEVHRMRFNFDNINIQVPHPEAVRDPKGPYQGKTISKGTLAFHTRRESHNWNSSNKLSWAKPSRKVMSSYPHYINNMFIYNDVKKGIRPTIDFNYPDKTLQINLVCGDKAYWDAFVAREIERGMPKTAFTLASDLKDKPKTAKAKPTNVQIDYVRPSSRPSTIAWGSSCGYKELSTYTGKHYYVEATNFEVTAETQRLYKQYVNFVTLGILPEISILVINKKNQKHIQPSWKPFAEYLKVPASVIKKNQLVTKRAVYLAMRYGYINAALGPELNPTRLADMKRKYVNQTSSRVSYYVDTPLGKLLKDTREVALSVDNLRYQVSKIKDELITLASHPHLEAFIRQVTTTNHMLQDHNYQSFTDAYEVDFEALKGIAMTNSSALERVQEYLLSQTYYVVAALGGRTYFDLQKLKKELSQ